MIVRTYSSSETSQIFASNASRVLVVPEDGMGHLLFDTILPAGARDSVRAPGGHSAQAHYCVSGQGTIMIAGRSTSLSPGKIVAASGADECSFEAMEDMKICSIYGVADIDGVFVERTLSDIEGSDRDVFWGAGYSKRLLVKRDGLGFAFCVTIGHADKDSPLEYRNHLESCYYIEGTGEYVWQDGSRPILTEDDEATVFVMNLHDAHRMVIRDESVCLSIFTPAIEGTEAHDFTRAATSSY